MGKSLNKDENWIKKHRVAIICTMIGIVATIIISVILSNQTSRKLDDIDERVDRASGIDCHNLERAWTLSDGVVIKDQVFSLKENVIAGRIRLRKRFYNLFVLDVIFIPNFIEGADVIISFKDSGSNEVEMVIGYPVNKKGIPYGKVVLNVKKNGETLDTKYKILPGSIKRDEEVKIRLDTVLRAESIWTSGIMFYTPHDKPKEEGKEDIDIELPYNFQNGDFSLFIGLNKDQGIENKPQVKIIDCLIEEKDRP